MKNHIFVSYARTDLQYVDRIIATLDSVGFQCWIDIADIRFGRWSDVLDAAIRNAKVVLLIISPDSVASEWVGKEITRATELSKPIIPLVLRKTEGISLVEKLTSEEQRIPVQLESPSEFIEILFEALKSHGLNPNMIDLKDKRFLKARSEAALGHFGTAINVVEELLLRRPFHLAAVADLLLYCFEAGRSRILNEEQRGFRPPNQPDMVDEFRRAEVVASQYLAEDHGAVNGFFRAQLWVTLGKLSAFVGKYDDAFKRLETAKQCDRRNDSPDELLDELRRALSIRYTRDPTGRERPFQDVYPGQQIPAFAFPEPNANATWHAITFPFTVSLVGFKMRFPDGISESWQRLWGIDHNIGQLERLGRDEDVTKILTRTLEAIPEISALELARMGWRRIAAAVEALANTGNERANILEVAKRVLTSLPPEVSEDELLVIWSPEIKPGSDPLYM